MGHAPLRVSVALGWPHKPVSQVRLLHPQLTPAKGLHALRRQDGVFPEQRPGHAQPMHQPIALAPFTVVVDYPNGRWAFWTFAHPDAAVWCFYCEASDLLDAHACGQVFDAAKVVLWGVEMDEQ